MDKSYNGWTASPKPAEFGGISPLVVEGEAFAPGVRSGAVHTVLQYVATALHERVEPVYQNGWHQADDWGYNYRQNKNANNLSCHASGTAIDYNATRHPNGKSGTFKAGQVGEIRKILGEVDNVVRWGGDFTGTKDEMHFEICKGETDVARTAARLNGAPPAVVGGRSLYRGLTGEDVKKLQRVLNAWYPSLKLLADGVFGERTESAVIDLQKRAKLVADGVVGPATRELLGL